MKELSVSLLYDFYAPMLSDRAAEIVNLYYNQDMSLSEIAAVYMITKQGVKDYIDKSVKTFYELEDKLRLFERYRATVDKLNECAARLKAGEQGLAVAAEIDKFLKEL
ncbi:MAG: hypothetical protein LBS99_07015 [Clostridiales bacterium]|jgi:predicted DNA-binding protein YlxM (UPF0122 family)|nr:hypothetical protein [Clostridiales bacterium]